jgi:RNA polymerase sigma factor for flagellar operon FliA
LDEGGRVAHQRPLTEDERYRANQLAAAHLDLVQHVVNQVAMRYPRHVDRQELWSAGAYGLVDAARAYRPETGIPFPRYATIRIRGAIIDSTRSRDWAARSVRRGFREMQAAEERFESEHGRRPGDEELARLLGIGTDDLRARRSAAASASLLHLDQPDVDDIPLGDRIAEQSIDRLPDAAFDQGEMVESLRRAVVNLPPIQREVVERYYLDGELLQNIAESMSLTEARVSQIRSEAVNSMRAYFTLLYDGVPEVANDAPGKRSRAAYVATLAGAPGPRPDAGRGTRA